MTLTQAQKRQNKFDRMLEDFKQKQSMRTYAFVLDICAKTFQKLRVMESANDDGVCSCCTCGKLMMWNEKDSQGGHYIARHHTAAIFVPSNVNVQCGYFCNGQGGKPTEYRQWLVRQHGEQAVQELENMNFGRKYSLEELVEMRLDWLERIAAETKRLR